MENNIKDSDYVTQLELSRLSSGDGKLQLCPISLKLDYCQKWNIVPSLNDFLFLTKDGKILRNVLYRKGGLNLNFNLNNNYFMLIKHVESYYKDEITKDHKKKPHLEGRWCILDKFGNEKVEFASFKSPYLVKDSQIYSIDNKYYNIETGELYCTSYSSMESSDFLFLNNEYDKDESKRGVMKLNKKDGTFELFKSK